MKKNRRRFPLLKCIISILTDEAISTSIIEDLEYRFKLNRKKSGLVTAFLRHILQSIIIIIPLILDSLVGRIIMIRSYMKISLRHISRQKFYSFINIAGLGIGIAVSVLIMLWVFYEVKFDGFHEKSDRLGRVIARVPYSGGQEWAVTEAPLAGFLKDNFPEIEDAVRMKGGRGLKIKGNGKLMRGHTCLFTESSLFHMFSFPWISGVPETALLDPNSIVVTRSMALRYFGTTDVLSKRLTIRDRFAVTITGLMDDVPSNSHLQFDYLLPFSLFEKIYGIPSEDWGNSNYFSYVLLREGISFSETNEKIQVARRIVDSDNEMKLFLQPFMRIHLHSNFVYDVLARYPGDITHVFVFSAVAVFILIIACINFINLATARAGQRGKEVGLRKTMGGSRLDLIYQFFGEILVLSIFALLFGLLVAFLAQPYFFSLAGREMSFHNEDWKIIGLGLFAVLCLTGFGAGAYPALYLSSFQPTTILKGSGHPDKKQTSFRRALVLIQFSIAVIMIVGTLVVTKQLRYMHNKELGFTKELLIAVPLTGQLRAGYSAFKTDILSQPDFLSMTSSTNLPTYGRNWATEPNWEGRAENLSVMMQGVEVDEDFLETFELNMIKGRFFSENNPTDLSEGLVLNQTAVKAMNVDSPINMKVRLFDQDYRIIGVIEDYHFKSLHHSIEPLILRHVSLSNRNYAFTRIHKDRLKTAIGSLEKIWKSHNPGEVFNYQFVDGLLARLYLSEVRIGKLFSTCAGLAIFIACLGLLGLAAFIAEQRTKEIGIRKVLGASVRGLVLLLTGEFFQWLVIANLIAGPIAYVIMTRWLQNFAFRTAIGVQPFLTAAVLVFGLTGLMVSYIVLKAARANPVDAIRDE